MAQYTNIKFPDRLQLHDPEFVNHKLSGMCNSIRDKYKDEYEKYIKITAKTECYEIFAILAIAFAFTAICYAMMAIFIIMDMHDLSSIDELTKNNWNIVLTGFAILLVIANIFIALFIINKIIYVRTNKLLMKKLVPKINVLFDKMGFEAKEYGCSYSAFIMDGKYKYYVPHYYDLEKLQELYALYDNLKPDNNITYDVDTSSYGKTINIKILLNGMNFKSYDFRCDTDDDFATAFADKEHKTLDLSYFNRYFEKLLTY